LKGGGPRIALLQLYDKHGNYICITVDRPPLSA
jgi:hypothetical protein